MSPQESVSCQLIWQFFLAFITSVRLFNLKPRRVPKIRTERAEKTGERPRWAKWGWNIVHKQVSVHLRSRTRSLASLSSLFPVTLPCPPSSAGFLFPVATSIFLPPLHSLSLGYPPSLPSFLLPPVSSSFPCNYFHLPPIPPISHSSSIPPSLSPFPALLIPSFLFFSRIIFLVSVI